MGRFLGIIGQDPSVVSKSNRLHVVVFQFFVIIFGYIPLIILHRSAILLKSQTSTGQFFPFSGLEVPQEGTQNSPLHHKLKCLEVLHNNYTRI